MFGFQAFLGLLEVSVFVVLTRRLKVPIHGIWRTGSRGGHWRRTKREKSNTGQGKNRGVCSRETQRIIRK